MKKHRRYKGFTKVYKLVGYKEFHEFLEWGVDRKASIFINCSSRLSLSDVYDLLYKASGLREGEVEYISCGPVRPRSAETLI